MTNKKVIGYPFVSHVDQNLRPYIDSPIDFLKKYYDNDNIAESGQYKLMGYIYDFTPYLKKYLYKQYGRWHERYAVNKTLLRKSVYGKIDSIICL